MADQGASDYFVVEAQSASAQDDERMPLVVPVVSRPAQQVAAPAPVQPTVPSAVPAPTAVPGVQQPTPAASVTVMPRPAPPREPSREELLAAALDGLMQESADIHAAALVSLDGFTMASALPAEMQSDRVGAMSAAILALGERAAAELSRGHLSQVFIEGEDGYIFLVAAGTWAVLTAIADPSAKLGLVIYDMKKAAERIGQILG